MIEKQQLNQKRLILIMFKEQRLWKVFVCAFNILQIVIKFKDIFLKHKIVKMKVLKRIRC